MGELSKIAKEFNLPKQMLDKGEKAIKAVLGPSITEISETIADSFRLRRFKNQVAILSKAQSYLENKGLEPKQVNLKVLTPLLEFSSLEEDSNLQERWSKLITNIVSIKGETMLKQNCIDIISKISNDEAQLLDYLFDLFHEMRQARYTKNKANGSDKRLTDYTLNMFSFAIRKISKSYNINRSTLELMVSNLVALGVLKWVPEVDVYNAEKSYPDPDDTSLDIDIEVYDDESLGLTNLGFEFVKMCKLED